MAAEPAVPVEPAAAQRRRAGVLGSPVAHSRSPQIHLAAYRALGLDWDYERLECSATQLPALVGGLGPQWVGLSVTMPGKVAALAYASTSSEPARLVGAVNTLVRQPSGDWHGDCTDIDGVLGALRGAGVAQVARAVVVGAGGTARPALVGLAQLGAGEVTLVVRSPARAAAAVALAQQLKLTVTVREFAPAVVESACAAADVVVSTVPAAAAAAVAQAVAAAPVVLDVIYDPWPTPLAQAVTRAGHLVCDGLEMLLEQAYRQVELFTGCPAPRAAMAAAVGR